MFREAKLAWARAKALSVLQNAYEMPLRHPLSDLDATDLDLVITAAFETGGNEFDAAAAFMTYRIKSVLQTELKLGKKIEESARSEIPKIVVGFAGTKSFVKFYELHMTAIREIGRLRTEADAALERSMKAH